MTTGVLVLTSDAAIEGGAVNTVSQWTLKENIQK